MQVVAGQRAVHITLSYDLADWVTVCLPVNSELRRMMGEAIAEARCKGRPLPPFPKNTVAHNSTVEIVK